MDMLVLGGVGIAVLLAFLMLIGLEIGWSLGVAATVGLVFYVDQPLSILGDIAFSAVNSFTLTAMALFILMGSILGNTGINRKMFNAIEKWVGGLPGGLACAVIFGNAVFGAMCGSVIAATATFGKLAYPVMEEREYSPRLALGSIASGTILSPLIPPSLLLIIYGAWQGLSIVDLLSAGVVPGILLTVLLIITVLVWAKVNPESAPPVQQHTMQEKIGAIVDILPFVGLIAAVLGSIFSGIMTPTEASALGVLFSFLLTVYYKCMNWKIFKVCLMETVKVSAFSLMIMAMANVLTHVYNSAGIILMLKDVIMGLPVGRTGILLLLVGMYLVMGTFLGSWTMLFLTFPFVIPILEAMDVNLIWWGIIYVLAAEQSSLTPPFGLTLFVLKNVVPKHSIATIFMGCLPFLIPIYITVILLFFFPEIVMWLPNRL